MFCIKIFDFLMSFLTFENSKCKKLMRNQRFFSKSLIFSWVFCILKIQNAKNSWENQRFWCKTSIFSWVFSILNFQMSKNSWENQRLWFKTAIFSWVFSILNFKMFKNWRKIKDSGAETLKTQCFFNVFWLLPAQPNFKDSNQTLKGICMFWAWGCPSQPQQAPKQA